MQTRLQYTALIACVMLVLPSAAFADPSPKSKYAEQQLQVQLASLTCTNAYLDGSLNAIVTAINNSTTTATLSTDITKTSTDFAALQTDVNSGNTAQLKTDVKTYQSDSKTANLDARVAIKTTHSKTISATIKSESSKLRPIENSCLFVVKQQRAHLKIDMYNENMARAQNMTKKM